MVNLKKDHFRLPFLEDKLLKPIKIIKNYGFPRLSDNTVDIPENIKLHNESFNKILRTRSLHDNFLQFGNPKTSKVMLQPKDPIKYSVEKKILDLINDLKIRSNTLEKPISDTNSPKYNNVFDKFEHNDEKQNNLFVVFKKMDKNEDGHLEFDLIEKAYLKNYTQEQKSFFSEVYNMLSESTFFGLREFFVFEYILDKFDSNIINEKLMDSKKKLENYWNYFTNCNFSTYREEIKIFLNLFEAIDFDAISINVYDVLKLKSENMEIKKELAMYKPLMAQLNRPIKGYDQQEKLTNSILLIPLFIYLESVSKKKVKQWKSI